MKHSSGSVIMNSVCLVCLLKSQGIQQPPGEMSTVSLSFLRGKSVEFLSPVEALPVFLWKYWIGNEMEERKKQGLQQRGKKGDEKAASVSGERHGTNHLFLCCFWLIKNEKLWETRTRGCPVYLILNETCHRKIEQRTNLEEKQKGKQRTLFWKYISSKFLKLFSLIFLPLTSQPQGQLSGAELMFSSTSFPSPGSTWLDQGVDLNPTSWIHWLARNNTMTYA